VQGTESCGSSSSSSSSLKGVGWAAAEQIKQQLSCGALLGCQQQQLAQQLQRLRV
jgi:hypothetical protein